MLEKEFAVGKLGRGVFTLYILSPYVGQTGVLGRRSGLGWGWQLTASRC